MERQKVKYVVAFNNTVVSVPARDYVFVLADAANARTGKRGQGDGKADIKLLRAYGRGVLNKTGKLLVGFTEDNKLALSHLPKCRPQQGASTFGLYLNKLERMMTVALR